MACLPREVLKWVQSLDLSFSVRNPRRDFCNGFLVAEIMSRYYRADVTMHSFENGNSLSRRRNNWEQLEKFFGKMAFPIEHGEVEDVLYAREGAVASLLCKIYTILTGKTVKQIEPLPSDDVYVPGFAAPTTSQRIKLRMAEPALADKQDAKALAQQAAKVLEEQDEKMRSQRMSDRERFGVSPAQTQQQRVPTRRLAEGAEPAAPALRIEFEKDVQVKKIEGSIAQLRASRLHQRAPSAGSAAGANSPRGSAHGNGVPAAAAAAAAPAGLIVAPTTTRSTMDMLNECVRAVFQGVAELKTSHTDKQPARALVDHVREVPDESAALVFSNATAAHAEGFAASCLASPKEFWTWASLTLDALLAVEAGSRTFRAAAEHAVEVARRMVARDHYTPWALCADFALEKLVRLVRGPAPAKRADAVRILFAFCMPAAEETAKALETLRGALGDAESRVFVECAALVGAAVTDYSDGLVALFAAAAAQCFADSSSRTLGLRVFANLASDREHGGFDAALKALPSGALRAQPDDPVDQSRWQLVLATRLLQRVGPSNKHTSELVATMLQLLSPAASPRVLLSGLALLAPLLRDFPELRVPWVSLAAQSPDLRARLLGEVKSEDDTPALLQDGGGHPHAGVGALDLELPVQRRWHALSVVEAVAEHLERTRAPNLSAGHLDLLAAATARLRVEGDAEAAQWIAVFERIKNYLLVEMCDERSCSLALQVLRAIFADPLLEPAAVSVLAAPEADRGKARAPPLFGVLKVAFGPGANPHSQKALFKLLDELATQRGKMRAPAAADCVLTESVAAQAPSAKSACSRCSRTLPTCSRKSSSRVPSSPSCWRVSKSRSPDRARAHTHTHTHTRARAANESRVYPSAKGRRARHRRAIHKVRLCRRLVRTRVKAQANVGPLKRRVLRCVLGRVGRRLRGKALDKARRSATRATRLDAAVAEHGVHRRRIVVALAAEPQRALGVHFATRLAWHRAACRIGRGRGLASVRTPLFARRSEDDGRARQVELGCEGSESQNTTLHAAHARA
jgi:hypothetical protein